MATPASAKHHDLVQDVRDLKAQVSALVGASLRRQQLSVTEGDFVVSGGGSVVVKDRGYVSVMFPESVSGDDDSVAAGLGDLYTPGFGSYLGTGVLVSDHLGSPVLWAISGPDGLRDSGQVHAYGGTGLILAAGPTGQVQVGLGSNAGVFIGHATTSAAANVNLLDTGFLSRVTSSLRYKTRVEDATVDPAAVLSINGRTWVDRKDEDDPDADRHVGFIAEELHDAGLTDFVVYDDEGRPDAIQYDRLSVALLAVAKAQQSQLDALSARLDALEAKA